MIRMLSALAITALVVSTGRAPAAPRPEERSSGPAVVGQAKSFNDMLDMTRAMVKNLGGAEMAKAFEKEALPHLDPKKLPGIDPTRPFGLYGIVDADLTKCRAVILIPVTSQKDFLDMLESLDIRANKGKEEGTFDIVVPPDFPFPVAIRIQKGYAYVAVGGFDVLDSKVILDPKEVINDKEKAVAYLALRLDRVPAETRKFLIAALRDKTEQLKDVIPEPEVRDAFGSVAKLSLRWLRTLFDEGREVAFRLDANTKTGEVFVEMAVEGQPKSALAGEIAKLPPTKNAFASVPGDDYVQRMLVSAPLTPDELKDALVKLVEYGEKQAVKEVARNSGAEMVALVEASFKSLKATIASGPMDLAVALRGPNKDGFYTAIGAVHCKEGAQLEKAARAAVKTLPEPVRQFFKFDAGKIGDVPVHEVDLSGEAQDVARRIFGNGQKAYVAFGKDALYAAYGPDGMKFLKEAMAARPGPAAVLDSMSNGKKTAELFKKMVPPDNPNGVRMSFGFIETASSGLQVTVEGGDRLKVRVGLNVGAMLIMGFGAYAEATPARAVAPPPVAAPAAPPPPPPLPKKD